MSSGATRREKLEAYFNTVTSADNVFNRQRPFRIEEALDWYRDPATEYAYLHMQELSGKNILDIGCGIGAHLVYFGRRGARVVGIDIAKERIRIAQGIIKDANLETSVKLYAVDIFDAHLPAGHFDYVYGHDILMYMERNYYRLIKELKRLLKPGGKIVFVEGLRDHPIACLYRRLFASKKWLEFTDYFAFDDLQIFEEQFINLEHKEFYIFGFLAYFWKIYVPSKKIFHFFERLLFSIDTYILKAFPFLKRYCWRIAFFAEMP